MTSPIATAYLKSLRMSPRKVRLLANLITGMAVAEAVTTLSLSKRDAAKPLLKLLKSAVANAAHNQKVDVGTLRVESVAVDGGAILYRWMPRAMGRATPIRKRTSHVTLNLSSTRS